jgi:predicted RNA-binding Zn ribbon-like protein
VVRVRSPSDVVYPEASCWAKRQRQCWRNSIHAFRLVLTGADLANWLSTSDLRVSIDATTEADLSDAKRLRQAIFQCARRLAHGQGMADSEVDVLNAAAAHPPLTPRIFNDPPPAQSTWMAPATARQALSTLARDAIDLFTGPLVARIRECGAVNCALLFVDTSRPGARRWCSMERCGNRAKVRAHRRRTRGPAGP